MQSMTRSRPLRVKFILPALTEATSPYWRPIKYSLFPPLGLATLAAYLRPDDEAVIVDEHVERLVTDDTPDLVVIQVYITNAYRAYRIADRYRAARRVRGARRASRDVAAGGSGASHADAIFLGPGSRRSRCFSITSARATRGRSIDRPRDGRSRTSLQCDAI